MPTALILRLLPYIGIILFAVGLFFYGDLHGASRAELKCATAQTTAIKQEIKSDETIQQKVQVMPPTAVTRELRAHWMRGE